ncbi:MAG: efflux RND transporter permease subunit [Candidatus Omnitrophica bacterium]|nr:efflux RND transporter permease subunit [Candidatus Omnitrophota bacterium]
MSLSRLAITRPITVIMMFSAAVLIGLISLFFLPVELYPNVSMNDISIIIIVRGGIPPTEVESMVTKPIEEAVSTVSHMKQLLSVSKEGESRIILSFEPGTNMDFVALEVREKFAKVKNDLPKEAEKPIIAQFKQTDTPIVILAVTSTKRTTESIRKIVDETVKERLKRIQGVANVEVSGGRERKILVELDKREMFKHRISEQKVISKIGANNLDILSGEYKDDTTKYLIRTLGAFQTVENIKDLPIDITTSANVIRLKDIAKVEDSFLEAQTYARMNVRPVVSIYIQKESTANTIKVAQEIEDEVEKIRQVVPKDLKILMTSSRATFIKSAIANLNISLLRGVVLIVLMLCFFMGHIPANRFIMIGFSLLVIGVITLPTIMLYLIFIGVFGVVLFQKSLRSILIVTLSIPISVIITFGLMEICNNIPALKLEFSINFITMFGLALGVGMLVDNSIVVFENILKKTEEGLDKFGAALRGSTEMNTVIIASTITTVIVFLPMVFLKSEMSMMYSGVAWTITFSLVVSLFVALTMVPLMASRMPIKIGKNEKFLEPVYKVQKKILVWMMRFRRGIIVKTIVVILLGIALFLFTKIGKELVGGSEQNKFTIFVELPTGVKLDVSDKVVKRVELILKDIPEVKSFSSRVEAWSSKVYVELVGGKDRQRSVQEVIDAIRPKTDKIKPAFIYFEEEREQGTKEILLDVFGYDYDILRELAISMATRLNGVKGLSDTKIRMREGRPELGLKIDRHKAKLHELNAKKIGDSVHAQMRGMRATMFHTEANEVETIARLDEKYRKTFQDVHGMLLVQDNGDIVLLDQVAGFKYGLGPSEIWRKDRSRMIQVSSNIASIPLSKAASMVREALKDIKFPENYFYRIGGDYPNLLKNQSEFKVLMIIILALIYIVLAAIFESYYQPLIIMTTVAFAAIGAIFALFFSKTSIGMGSLIGMMMLSGIVVNNGIILVEHINLLRNTDPNIYRVLLRVSRERLRPVLMTSVTTFIALLPMAFDTTEGSNLWRPLAITVIGGLVVSMPLTLLLTASIYLLFERIKNFVIDLLSKLTSKLKILFNS